ncbi:Rrf2 family transcriptional regulator [Psychrobacter sp. FDAARGOS_221]|uniref:Rrf2 family transcriptional regulator n=1 Tax=Psychrobacter sp. FDAARGOS_221 TaxID=1975705 RepID=UPI000BB569E2|nr:Rrf2 family transcriptional regulator [Psychrobacter sp. FDAARGOS_221]PNK61535.1 Rrf2 family transcriptional regulator [Psychrobacter sp. FDAARGOS_221]
MRLTNYSDFALRTLMYLAVRADEDTLATITEIANSYQISRSHLTKVIHQLAQIGYIESIRGKNGGIRLAKDPKDIVLGDVIRHTEPDFYMVACFQPPHGSDDDSAKNKAQTSKSNTSKAKPIPEETIPLKQQTGKTEAKPVLSCSITPACHLKSVFAEAIQAFLQVLDNYTLADVVTNDEELWQILKLHLS